LVLAERAARQWGVVSNDDLRACGLSFAAVSRRVRHGHLHRLHRGVYAVGHPRPPLEGRFLAAVMACGPGAVLSHFSAAALLGLVRWDARYPEVTVMGSGTRRHPGIRVHRTGLLEKGHVMRRGVLAHTSPARTLIDLASQLDYAKLRRAVRQALSMEIVELRELVELLSRLGERRGAGKLARIVATGPAPTRSELEDAVLDLILAGGLAHPKVGVPVVLADRVVVPDFRWPEQRLVIEADGAAWHDNKLAREDDAERQALLEARGDQVLRVTWDQAMLQPAQTIARIKAAGAPRAAGGRDSPSAPAAADQPGSPPRRPMIRAS
jgi:hypothetical protein